MSKVGCIFSCLAVCFYAISAEAQLLKGQIIFPSNPTNTPTVLDPNGDGFVSKTTSGFSSSTNYWVPEFEINMFGIPQVGSGDVTGDNVGKNCGITDLIPDIKGHSVYAVKDGNNNLIFRFRVGSNNPSVEAWTILLDTDGLFGTNDPNNTPGNPGFEIDITLIKNKNFGVQVYNINGTDACPTPLISYPIDTHFQISVADEATCGDPDYFYDYYVPLQDLATLFGISLSTGVRIAAATNVSATCAMGGNIADISGVDNTDAAYKNCDACAFTALVNNQCPTSISNLCSTCSGFNNTPVDAPGINQPVVAGQTSISGTCDSGNYIVVQIYSVIAGTTNQWSTTPRATYANYAVGINWLVSFPNDPLRDYDKIIVTAQFDANTPPCGLNGGSQSSTSVTVVRPNTAPVANPQTVNVVEDTPTAITLTASDADSDPLTYTLRSNPTHGTLSGSGANWTYTPAANYNGPDSFNFRATDIGNYFSDATVTINVTPVNDPPVPNGQSVTTLEDTPVGITLSGSDIEGSTLAYIVVAQPQHGSLTGSGANLTYTPAANYNGVDNFTFKVNDGTADSNGTANVLITISPVNDAPVANPQTVNVTEDAPKSIILSGTDVDGDPLTYTIVSQPTHGTLSGTAPNVTYTPNLNYNGGDSFTFRVNDGTVNSNIATVTLTFTPVNDAPVASGQTVTVTEDIAKGIAVVATDVDNDPLTYAIVAQPSHGTITGVGPNFTYTPALNYNGSDSFTFKANDGTVDSNVALVTITVTPVNDPPVANTLTLSTPEDTQLPITLTATDVDGDLLTFSVVVGPSHGALTGTAPNLTYTPVANYNGGDSFTFKANDGTVDSNVATVTITVTPVNDAPIASGQSVTVTEDVAKSIVLTATDVDGNTLTYSIVTPPAHGSLSGSAPNVTYTPTANYNGPDSFTFRANDGTTNSNTATVSITVTPVNDAPVANDQGVTTTEDVSKAITLTANDVDGDALTYIIVAQPANGTLTGTGQNVTYTPNSNYNGTDNFTFKVFDGALNSNIATVSITISAVNDAPIANNQTVTTAEDTPVAVNLNASDVDGNTLTYTVTLSPAHGVLTGTAPNLTYTPAADYNGSDSFKFKANDGTVDSNIATVSITVTAVNDAPVANGQNLSTLEDTQLGITLIATDVDAGTTLTYSIVTGPTNGTLSGTAPNVTYTPLLNYNGSDSFSFRASDGSLNSNTAIISITVTPVNDAPVADNQTVIYTIATPQPITLTGSDVDGNTLTYTVVSGPTQGTLNTTTGPNITYTPTGTGSDQFTFKVNDGSADSNIATVFLNPSGSPNGPPTASDQSASTNEDVPVTIVLVANDPDGDPITYTIVSPPSNGTNSISGANVTYTPSLNYNGSDSFTFHVSDNQGHTSADFTVTITVNPVNDPPVANSQGVATNEDTPVAINLVASDVETIASALIYHYSAPSHGSLSGTAPNLNYTPDADYNGSDSFTFFVNDGSVDSNTATVTITVNPVNDAPVANNQTVSTPEDTQATITLVGTDIDGDALTYALVAGPTNGSVTISGVTVVYTPSLNYDGGDSFTFDVKDPSLATSSPATVTITVTPVNDPPTTTGQSITIAEDNSVFVTLTGSDVDIGDVLSFNVLSQPQHGTLVLQPDGSWLYTPIPDFNGHDSFTFDATDGHAPSNVSTIDITVTPVNDPPTANSQSGANNQTVVTPEDTPVQITVTASDVDGDPLTYGLPVTLPTHGTLSGSLPNVTYTPDPDYNGPDSFTFRVFDGLVFSNTATVAIDVTPVDDAPVANNQTAVTSEDTPLNGALTGSDIDSNTFTYSIAAQPSHGTVSIPDSSLPNFVYTPAANYNGVDNFTFQLNDGSLPSNVATVSITITPVVDAPIANNNSLITNEDTPKSVVLTGSDVDGNTITFHVTSQPLHGTLSGTEPNLTYSPALNFNGADSFTFTASDVNSTSVPATITITVTPVNDPPVADAQSVTLAEDTPTSIVLTATDVDGDVLTFTLASQPVNGTLSGNPPNLTYTPSANYFGIDAFTFYASDQSGNSNTATVALTITPVNDPPTTSDQTVTVAEDNSIIITLTGSDVDGDQLTFVVDTPPAHGTLTGSGSTLTYTPDPNFNGNDSFTYHVSDGIANSNESTVSIVVTPVNDAPTANNQSGANDQTVTTPEDTPVAITLTATDVDGDALTYTLVDLPTHGSLTGTPPDVTYSPDLNFNGADSFTFKANDGIADSNIATVAINVTPVNDPPQIQPIPNLHGVEDTQRLVCLSVIDVDSNVITFTSPNNQLGGGSMTKSSAFSFCFDFNPAKNYNGRSIWTLGACDESSACATIDVEIDILPVNDPPVAVNDYIDVEGRSDNTIFALANDLPIEAPYKEFYDIYEKDSTDTLTIDRAVAFRGVATVTNNGKSIEYVPNFDWIGPDSIRYRIYDSGKLYDSAVVFINVGPPPFRIYQGLSPNGDGKNDYWHIDGIEGFPNNLMRIFDRFNNVVYETHGYSNESNNWTGQANHGLTRGNLPEGTYFYSLDLGDGRGPLSGYVVLKRN